MTFSAHTAGDTISWVRNDSLARAVIARVANFITTLDNRLCQANFVAIEAAWAIFTIAYSRFSCIIIVCTDGAGDGRKCTCCAVVTCRALPASSSAKLVIGGESLSRLSLRAEVASIAIAAWESKTTSTVLSWWALRALGDGCHSGVRTVVASWAVECSIVSGRGLGQTVLASRANLRPKC